MGSHTRFIAHVGSNGGDDVMRNLSGTYKLVNGYLVRVSEHIPSLHRPVFFNKGGVRAWDRSANREFASKTEKRGWLKQHGMREAGIINSDKAP